jgi:hypothetical protein
MEKILNAIEEAVLDSLNATKDRYERLISERRPEISHRKEMLARMLVKGDLTIFEYGKACFITSMEFIDDNKINTIVGYEKLRFFGYERRQRLAGRFVEVQQFLPSVDGLHYQYVKIPLKALQSLLPTEVKADPFFSLDQAQKLSRLEKSGTYLMDITEDYGFEGRCEHCGNNSLFWFVVSNSLYYPFRFFCGYCHSVCPSCDRVYERGDFSLNETIIGFLRDSDKDFPICYNCAYDLYPTCESCDDHIFNPDDRREWEGYCYCESCFDDQFSYCEDCNNPHPSDNLLYDESSDSQYCENCYVERPRTSRPVKKSHGFFRFGQEIEHLDRNAVFNYNFWQDASGPWEFILGTYGVDELDDYRNYLWHIKDNMDSADPKRYVGSHYHFSFEGMKLDSRELVITLIVDFLLLPLYSRGYTIHDGGEVESVNRPGIDNWAPVPNYFSISRSCKHTRVNCHSGDSCRRDNWEIRSAEIPGIGIVILSETLRRIFSNPDHRNWNPNVLWEYFKEEEGYTANNPITDFFSEIFGFNCRMNLDELRETLIPKILGIFGEETENVSGSFFFRHKKYLAKFAEIFPPAKPRVEMIIPTLLPKTGAVNFNKTVGGV